MERDGHCITALGTNYMYEIRMQGYKLALMNHKDLTNMLEFDLCLRGVTLRTIWTERKNRGFNKTPVCCSRVLDNIEMVLGVNELLYHRSTIGKTT
jgi:hypothetical protein